MEPKKNTARRDRLIELESRAQYLWRRENVFKAQVDKSRPKYFETFPYPYMNGRLHLGHGYSLTKCDFNARYKTLSGFNVLFPFGFHCTGMPISAAAEKLRREIELYGNPQVLPKEVQTELLKKGKQSQYEILTQMGIGSNIIEKFNKAEEWCYYFPPIGKEDLIKFGCFIDFDRSFITTSLNPYYDSFIRWQFNTLKERGYLKFGRRPSIFSPKDKQMCADHDRAEGQGVAPQEFVLIKLEVLEQNAIMKAKLQGKKVFLVAATLRPQTMYGQTNCYLLPEGQYGAFEMKTGEVFICSDKSARNMSYQGFTHKEGQVNKLATFKGQEILGLPLKAPLAKYEKVYSLPMMTISMDKGTGVVTSVPSDAPDDWAALSDLKNKKALREKFNITDEMVNFDPVEIINIPGFGNLAALKACEDLKIKGQNDKALLAQAKDLCYKKGFYEGKMLVGKYAGSVVKDAKDLVKKDLVQIGEAVVYYEPAERVIARSGEECVVSFIDQWYLNYADEKWKQAVRGHLKNFRTNTPNVQKEFEMTVDWIHEWGCSRSFGLGTKIPFDERYLIESLSDSTIYMAYYTVAHMLQGDLNGNRPGLLGIKASDMTDDAWNYVFQNKQYKICNVPEYKLKIMRDSFEYWYPLDLRCSAKDLIKNHLTMSLFVHAAIWENQPQKWPRGFYCNGYIQVDGEKMSKSTGNFKLISDVCQEFGADASRLTCASAGDTLDDANFTSETGNATILQLSTIEMFYAKVVDQSKTYRDKSETDKQMEYFDNIFINRVYHTIMGALNSYQEMRYRDVVKFAVYELTSVKDAYLLSCNHKPRRDLMEIYLYWQLLIIYPICPHFGEVIYLDQFLQMVDSTKYPKYLFQARFPEIKKEQINYTYIQSDRCITEFMSTMRDAFTKAKKFNKDKEHKFSTATIIYRKNYQPFQVDVLKVLANQPYVDNETKADWRSQLNIENKQEKSNAMKFGTFVLKDVKVRGMEALQLTMPFDERELLRNFQSNMSKEFGVDIKIVEVSEIDNKDKKWQDAIGNTNPGRAQVIFE